jgi:hypothetical protein
MKLAQHKSPPASKSHPDAAPGSHCATVRDEPAHRMYPCVGLRHACNGSGGAEIYAAHRIGYDTDAAAL